MHTITLRLRDVQPNPYRDFEAVPLDRSAVEALRNSMRETGFWSGLQVRAHGDGHQLVFGHNRMQAAAQEFGDDHLYEFDLIEADEREMIRRMNFENLQDLVQPTLGHLRIGVRAARDQIIALMQAGDVEAFVPYYGDISNAKKALRDRDVTCRAIAQFLYGDEYRFRTIERVLNQVAIHPWQEEKRLADLTTMGAKNTPEDAAKREAIVQELAYDTEASKVFHRPAHAEAFRKAVVSPKVRAAVPKASQKGLAAKIASTLKQTAGGVQPPALGGRQGVAKASTPAEERLTEKNIERLVIETAEVLAGVSETDLAARRRMASYAKRLMDMQRLVTEIAGDDELFISIDALGGGTGSEKSDFLLQMRNAESVLKTHGTLLWPRLFDAGPDLTLIEGRAS